MRMPRKKIYNELVPIQFLLSPEDKEKYEQLCTAEEITMTEDLRSYVKRRISPKKAKKVKDLGN